MPLTNNWFPETLSSLTTPKPMELGLLGERVAKRPKSLLLAGGLTEAFHSFDICRWYNMMI